MLPACTDEPCGPARGVVDRVIDGDTVVLADGHRVRYLLVDTPEISGMAECFGPEAAEANRSLVEGREVDLEYDEVCRDDYDRLLAYVSIDGREINLTLVERGYACVLEIPPNGADRADIYRAAEQAAKDAGAGLWGVCSPPPC
ncbi:MAG: thermonuclease [Deltaproteobacteria bacterium]|nr:MAG: thermonuclease [Deltaproteobacteria bacterium]